MLYLFKLILCRLAFIIDKIRFETPANTSEVIENTITDITKNLTKICMMSKRSISFPARKPSNNKDDDQKRQADRINIH